MNTLGENIASLRKKKGMTQEALADAIGVSAQSVSKWENNTNMPDILLLPIIADIFEVSIDALYGRLNPKGPMEAEAVLERCCESIINNIGSRLYWSTLAYNYYPRFDITTEEQFLKERVELLKQDKRFRTAIVHKTGGVYYRDEFGGLLIKRPAGSWAELLENDASCGILSSLVDRDFRAALAELIKSRSHTFTISSLCGKCGIENSAALEEKLISGGLSSGKTVEIDGKDVVIYEFGSTRLFLILAILSIGKEYEEYLDFYCGYEGNDEYLYS